jgi:hypothetical protein
MAPPPFGNHDPNSDARFGYGTSGNGGAFNFNFVAGQGSNRTNTATIPSVVVYNGQNASVSDTSQRPFVTGIIPVVNDRRVMLENLQRAKAEYSAKQALLDVEQQREDQLAKDQERARLSASDERKRTIDAPLILSDDVQTPPPVKSTRAEEVRRLVGKAEQLERDGKTTAAVIYYREAARKATGAQLGRLRAKIRQLGK